MIGGWRHRHVQEAHCEIRFRSAVRHITEIRCPDVADLQGHPRGDLVDGDIGIGQFSAGLDELADLVYMGMFSTQSPCSVRAGSIFMADSFMGVSSSSNRYDELFTVVAWACTNIRVDAHVCGLSEGAGV